MPPKTWVEISALALKHNIATIRRVLSNGARLCCVVKANAYGHGLLEVAQICAENGADWLGVDSLEEGLKLRQNGLKTPILVLGYTPLANLGLAQPNDIALTVYNFETIDALPAGTKIHIKVETGTSRQGVLIENLVLLAKRAGERGLIIEGLSTHFANVEDVCDPSYAREQLQRFNNARAALKQAGFIVPIAHTACSAAIFLYPKTHFDMVRLGISLYGLWSVSLRGSSSDRGNRMANEHRLLRGVYLEPVEWARNDIKLKPVITWKTIIAQIKSLPAGTPVSYGLTERVVRDSTVAILPIGYWDGYDRKLSSCGEVLIHGKRCKVLGRVCMNMIVVDVTAVPDAKLEDEVVLLGSQGDDIITAEELAKKIGTINYEVVTRINPFIKRSVI